MGLTNALKILLQVVESSQHTMKTRDMEILLEAMKETREYVIDLEGSSPTTSEED